MNDLKTPTNNLQWLYQQLYETPSWNVGFLFSYIAIMVLPHATVGTWIIEDLFQNYNRSELNLICLILGVLLLLVTSFFLLRQSHQLPKERRTTILFYFISTCFIIILSYHFLIIINTELIHFLQYAILAILLFPLIQSYWNTLYWCTLLGAIDEAYQYWYLTSGRPDYFDFNDIILDLLGAALGLCILRFYQIPATAPKIPFWKSKAILSFFVLLTSSFLLHFFGYLALYPGLSQSLPAIILMVEVPTSFWTHDPHGVFHIVKPIEGLLSTCLLLIFYRKI